MLPLKLKNAKLRLPALALILMSQWLMGERKEWTDYIKDAT